MPTKFRFSSFNVENLFSRARVFNLKNRSDGDQILVKIGALDQLLRKETYTASIKTQIVDLYQELKFYVEIRENQGKLFTSSSAKKVKASGSNDWNGEIEFRRAKFNDIGRNNTAKVIRSVKADVACIVEAENRPTLVAFNSQLLYSRKFSYVMSIDGNDPRGIDVGLYSEFPIGTITSHVYDGTSRSKIFSRDCPEYQVKLPGGKSLYVLCNHLKSKGYGSQVKNDQRRKKQAAQVAKILEKYDLKKDLVVVAGDMNDTPDRSPLKPLLGTANLFDVLKLQFPNDPDKRWTYYYKSKDQIDYVLVSKPLKDAFQEAGVERRGIYNLKKITNGAEKSFSSVTHWTNAASDHGAVWAEFDV